MAVVFFVLMLAGCAVPVEEAPSQSLNLEDLNFKEKLDYEGENLETIMLSENEAYPRTVYLWVNVDEHGSMSHIRPRMGKYSDEVLKEVRRLLSTKRYPEQEYWGKNRVQASVKLLRRN